MEPLRKLAWLPALVAVATPLSLRWLNPVGDSLGSSASAPGVVGEPQPLVSMLPSEPSSSPLFGVVVAGGRADLRAPVAGHLKRVLVGLGDVVAAGQVVAELDAQRSHFELGARLGAVQKYAADLAAARAEKLAATRQLRRASVLARQGLTSDEELEKAERAADAAELAVQVAEAELTRERAELGRTKFDHEALAVRAPFRGTVTAIDARVGARVEVNALILTLVDATNPVVRIAIPEEDFAKWQVGHVVELRLRSGGRVMRARMERIAPEIDALARVALAEARLVAPSETWPSGAAVEGWAPRSFPTRASAIEGRVDRD